MGDGELLELLEPYGEKSPVQRHLDKRNDRLISTHDKSLAFEKTAHVRKPEAAQTPHPYFAATGRRP